MKDASNLSNAASSDLEKSDSNISSVSRSQRRPGSNLSNRNTALKQELLDGYRSERQVKQTPEKDLPGFKPRELKNINEQNFDSSNINGTRGLH